MSTDLAVPAENGAVEFADSALVQWAYEAKQAHQIAQSLAQTSFVPASLRGKPHDITAAILAGQELGLQPMAALQSMDVIQGAPRLRAHAMRGLVQSRGHSVQVIQSTDTTCVMRGRRKGEEAWQEVSWTIERAAQLGLTAKEQWKKQPRTMLVARATGEICRLIAADVLHAMPYAAEEVDGEPVRAEATVGGRVTAAEILGTTPAPPTVAPAPANGGQPEPEPERPAAAPRGITVAQQRKLHALLNEKGKGEREVALVWMSGVVGRELTTSKDLTLDDARVVIDALEALPDPNPEPPDDDEARPSTPQPPDAS